MIRNYTYLIFTDFVYLRVKGLVWIYNGLTNHNNIDKNVGDVLKEIYISTEPSKPLVIDCKGISGITDHALDKLFKAINTLKREVHFLYPQKITQKLSSSKEEFCEEDIKRIDNGNEFIIPSENYTLKKENLISEVDHYILQKIKGFVCKCFHQYDGDSMQPLSSTPIYSNGEFDAAYLVSNPESFYLIAIRLADEVERMIQFYRIGNDSFPAKLLTVSLRASPFAAAVGLLLGYQIETVDHFGPIFKYYETDTTLTTVKEYIYIGDFTVGGTEIKVSKTYAHMKNSKLQHAFVISSLFKSNQYTDFNLHTLTLLQDSCPHVRYALNVTNA